MVIAFSFLALHRTARAEPLPMSMTIASDPTMRMSRTARIVCTTSACIASVT